MVFYECSLCAPHVECSCASGEWTWVKTASSYSNFSTWSVCRMNFRGALCEKELWPRCKRKTKEIDEDATWQCHGFAFDQLMSFVRSCSQLGGKLDGDDAPVLGPWWFFYMSALNGVTATVGKILWRRPPPDGILQRELDRSPPRRRFSGLVRHLLFFSERSPWTTNRRYYTQWRT